MTQSASPNVGCKPAIALNVEILSAQDIAEMMAEAARVDEMFQSMHLPTLFLSQFVDKLAAEASRTDEAAAKSTVRYELERAPASE